MGDEPHESDAVLASSVRKNKPKNTPFRQQTLKAFKPVPTVKSAVIIFTSIGLIFILIGSILVSYSKDIVEASVQYDNVQGCKGSNWLNPGSCLVELDVPDDMPAPVFFYYELHNYYQNHRRYVKSKSNNQLKGQDLGTSDISTDCDPIVSMSDLARRPEDMQGAWNLKPTDPANPCGLIAKSFFNDTFELYVNNTRVTVLETGIAWPSDKDRKFARVSSDWTAKQWLDVDRTMYFSPPKAETS